MKWSNYYPHFLRHIPNDAKRILEVGIWKGDGLRWLAANYPQAHLIGMDINTSPCTFRSAELIECNAARIYPEVKERLTNLDVIIDDGGHRPYQQAATFKALWPLLNAGGVYIIEDMHLCQRWHWRMYSKLFGIHPLLRRMIAAQSKWEGPETTTVRGPLAIHFFPQLVIIEKGIQQIYML